MLTSLYDGTVAIWNYETEVNINLNLYIYILPLLLVVLEFLYHNINLILLKNK